MVADGRTRSVVPRDVLGPVHVAPPKQRIEADAAEGDGPEALVVAEGSEHSEQLQQAIVRIRTARRSEQDEARTVLDLDLGLDRISDVGSVNLERDAVSRQGAAEAAVFFLVGVRGEDQVLLIDRQRDTERLLQPLRPQVLSNVADGDGDVDRRDRGEEYGPPLFRGKPAPSPSAAGSKQQSTRGERRRCYGCDGGCVPDKDLQAVIVALDVDRGDGEDAVGGTALELAEGRGRRPR